MRASSVWPASLTALVQTLSVYSLSVLADAASNLPMLVQTL